MKYYHFYSKMVIFQWNSGILIAKMEVFWRKPIWYQYMVTNYQYTDVIKQDFDVLFEKVLLW